MTGKICLLLLLLFVNAEAASTQQERKVNVTQPTANVQNVPTANVVSGANVPLVQNVAPVQQRQLVPLGTVNIPNLGNVPVYGVPVSINQAGQLQMGTGLGGLNLAGLNLAGLNGAGLNLAGLNGGSINFGNAVGASSSGVTRQMSAVSVLSVVVANLWYHWSF